MEQSFIQACLTQRLYPDRPLPAPPQGLDWDGVYALLSRHKLTGMFYLLGRAQPNLWPQMLQHRLRRDYHSALLWGDRCTEEVNAVLAALRRADIPVMVLKGWALIPTLYEGDCGQRTYADIDLLVLPRDAARAEHVVRGLGYGALPEPWTGFERRYGNGRAYQLPRDPGPFSQVFAIALHWELLDTPFYSPRMPVEHLFERARPLQVAGIDVCTLSAEDHLLYACGHLALHHTYDDALFRYYEMASLILQAGPAFDWNAVVARTVSWRLVLPVQTVLVHFETLWPGIVPAQALQEISALQPTPVERCIHHWVVEERDNHTVRAVLAWLTMPGLGRRWRFLLEAAFPSSAYMRQRYGPAPGGLWPLLYFRRITAAVRHIAQ